MTARPHPLANAMAAMQDRIDELEATLMNGEALVQTLLAALRATVDRLDALTAENAELRHDIDLVTEREREGRDLA